MKKSIQISLAAAALLFSAALAENSTKEESSVYELGQIEVTAKADISQNRAIDVVEESIVKDSEAKTIVEALHSVPGVYSTYSGGRGETNIRIRGFDSTRVPIFIDGIPVYVPYDRNMDLGRFKTYDISQISVSKGYVSPMYGPNTMGGAVNIITRKPVSAFEGEVGAGLMSGNGHEEFINLGTNQDLWYALISASNIQREYYKLPGGFKPDPNNHQPDRNRKNAEYKDRKLNLKVGLTPNDTDEYSFNFIMQRGDKEQPWATTPSGGSGGQYNRNWYWPDWDKTSFYLLTKTEFGEVFDLKTRWYYDKFYNKMYDRPSPPNTNINSISEYDDNTKGGIIEGDLKIADNHLLKMIVSQKFDNHKSIDSGSPNADVEDSDWTFSLGAEYSWKINDIFTWVTGATWDKNKVTKATMRNSGQTYIQGEHPKFESDAFNPQTILYAQISPELMLYGSFSRKSNMPTLKQRYSTRFGQYLYNPSLEAERSTTYEFGGDYLLTNDHLLKFALFYTKTDDYIGEANGISNSNPNLGCTGSNCRQSQNFDKETHKGLELSLNSYWSDSVEGVFSYTYIDAKIDKSRNSNAKYTTDTPEHSFYAGIKYSPISSVDIIPSIRYESERYTAVDGSGESTSYTVADLKVAYRPIKNLEISAGIKNIFDDYYYYNDWYPQEGRNYYANVRYKF